MVEQKNSIILLGVIGFIAIFGLVLMFTQNNNATGALFGSQPGGPAQCNVQTLPGEAQWFTKDDPALIRRYLEFGLQCAIIKDGKIIEHIDSLKALDSKARTNAEIRNMCCRASTTNFQVQ